MELQVYAIGSIKNNKVNSIEYNLSRFPYLSRNTIKEFIRFFALLCAEKGPKEGYQKTTDSDSDIQNMSIYMKFDQDASFFMVCDQDYQFTSAKLILDKLSASEATVSLKDLLILSQDPSKFNKVVQVQDQLDETKEILHKTLDSLITRGEKLDDLVAKSSQLSSNSKTFYRTAKKVNRSCCYIL